MRSSVKEPGKRLHGRWSRKWDCCQICDRTDSQYAYAGVCQRCYGFLRYYENHAATLAKRKARRMQKSDPDADYARVRAWTVANKNYVREYKRRWHAEHGPKPKWPVGMLVRVLVGNDRPSWCAGVIVERPHISTAVVRYGGQGKLARASVAKQTRIMSEEEYQDVLRIKRELRGAA